MAVLRIVLGCVACVITALSLGLLLFRLLRIQLQRLESLCLGYAAGSAVLSFLVFALAALGLARKGVFLSLTAVALAAAVYFRQWLLPPASPVETRVPFAWKILFAAALIAYGNLYFRQALSPEVTPDGMMYHLGLINLFNRAHGFVRYVDMYAGLPEGLEMLFFYAFAIGKHSAASLVHFSFLLDLAFLMALHGRRFASAGVAGALLVFASPLVAADGTCSYNDTALAAVTFAAVYLLALWRNDKSTGLLMACSIVTGFTMAIKYQAVLFALFVVVMIAIGLRGQLWRRRVLLTAAAGLVMSVGVAPYLVRNVLWFDNPVAFFGNSVFRNPYFHVAFEQSYARNMAHLNGLQWRDMPLELTIGGRNVEGCLGAVFLLAPLALAGLVWPRSRILVLAALATMVSFPAARSARYLIPALPMLALAIVFVIGRVRWSNVILAAIVIAHLVTSWPPWIDRFYTNPGWHVARVPWNVDLRRIPEDKWLSEHSEEYFIGRRIDALVPPDQGVLSMAGASAKSYMIHDITVVFQSARGEQLGDPLYATWNSAVSGMRQWSFRFPAVNAREVRLVQNGRTDNSRQWSVNEVRLQCNGNEVAIGVGVHPYASPNPWGARLAFDGNFVTRWRTWEPMQPGMYLGARFDAPLRVDSLTYLDFTDQWDSRVSLKVLDEAGRWIDEPSSVLKILPPVDRRKDAMELLKRAGIRYVVFSRYQWNSDAFLDVPGEWGLTPVAATSHYKLLRIE